MTNLGKMGMSIPMVSAQKKPNPQLNHTFLTYKLSFYFYTARDIEYQNQLYTDTKMHA